MAMTFSYTRVGNTVVGDERETVTLVQITGTYGTPASTPLDMTQFGLQKINHITVDNGFLLMLSGNGAMLGINQQGVLSAYKSNGTGLFQPVAAGDDLSFGVFAVTARGK